MFDYWEEKARYAAYRWFRNSNLEATHPEAWAFARDNWQRFLPPYLGEEGAAPPAAVSLAGAGCK
jgi:hypothetical protein